MVVAVKIDFKTGRECRAINASLEVDTFHHCTSLTPGLNITCMGPGVSTESNWTSCCSLKMFRLSSKRMTETVLLGEKIVAKDFCPVPCRSGGCAKIETGSARDTKMSALNRHTTSTLVRQNVKCQ